jgi:hypothetical protein
VPAKKKQAAKTVAILANNHQEVDAIVSVIVADGEGAEAFVSALEMVTDHYSATLCVGWTEASDSIARVVVDEEPEDEEEEQEDEDQDDDDLWTEDQLNELDREELEDLLEQFEVELDGRFGKQKAIRAILKEQA